MSRPSLGARSALDLVIPRDVQLELAATHVGLAVAYDRTESLLSFRGSQSQSSSTSSSRPCSSSPSTSSVTLTLSTSTSFQTLTRTFIPHWLPQQTLSWVKSWPTSSPQSLLPKRAILRPPESARVHRASLSCLLWHNTDNNNNFCTFATCTCTFVQLTCSRRHVRPSSSIRSLLHYFTASP